MSNRDRDYGRDGDGDTDVSAGAFLRATREAHGLSLIDVQRDLRIQASYLAAIENGDLAAFSGPKFCFRLCAVLRPLYGFRPDRSAPALLRPDRAPPWQSWRCALPCEGFEHEAPPLCGAARQHPVGWLPAEVPAFRKEAASVRHGFTAGNRLGLVLMIVAAGLGYGGWTVLQNVQRVEFAPVEDLPIATAEIAPLEAPAVPDEIGPMLTELASPVTATSLSDLYRQQEIEVPILAPRDGPIAAIDPDAMAPLAARYSPQETPAVPAPVDASQVGALAREGDGVTPVKRFMRPCRHPGRMSRRAPP